MEKVSEKDNFQNVNNSTEDSSADNFRLPNKYYLNTYLESKIKDDYPEVITLIKSLHKYIKKQQKKLKTLKKKLKKSITKTEDAFTQTLNDKPSSQTLNITEEITQAAELAVQNSGFVFEETSGLYYDYNTGYYYNAELGLYYDGNKGIYMSYDQESKSYKFQSKVHIPTEKLESQQNRHKTKIKRKHSQDKNQVINYCNMDHLTKSFNNMNIDSLRNFALEIANSWPPCMRIIVEDSSVPKLKVGSLHIITYEGGSLGREGNHSILIPDINTSKHHLKFMFNKNSNQFLVVDLGSRNGTILNGKRMSASKQESQAQEVPHGSRIQIGSTVLLCHVHNGNETCGLCEPGLLQNDKPEENVVVFKSNKVTQHKKELQRLKKKFGISSQDNSNANLPKGYSDRAQTRRETIGSHNEHEKTEVASVNESIKSTNIGFKLLSKMGWSEGQSLGKDGSGISEPIQPKMNSNNTGLGCETSEPSISNLRESSNKGKMWIKTQQRFQQLAPSTNIFEESD